MLAGGEAIEIVEQRLHGRVEPVPLRELQRQALGERAGEDSGRRELLAAAQHALDACRRRAELRGEHLAPARSDSRPRRAPASSVSAIARSVGAPAKTASILRSSSAARLSVAAAICSMAEPSRRRAAARGRCEASGPRAPASDGPHRGRDRRARRRCRLLRPRRSVGALLDRPRRRARRPRRDAFALLEQRVLLDLARRRSAPAPRPTSAAAGSPA